MTKAPTVTAEEVRALRKTVEQLEREQTVLFKRIQELEVFVEDHQHKLFTGKAYSEKKYL